MNLALKQEEQIFGGAQVAYDGRANLYATNMLPLEEGGEKLINIAFVEGDRSTDYAIRT
jgi:hypothetical protein